MYIKKCFFLCLFTVSVQFFLAAQTHIAVPLGHPVYHVIEQAQLRGLHRFLPSVRPYTRAQVLDIITEILNNDANLRFGGLTQAERRILQQFRRELNPPRGGFDLTRGTITREHTWNDIYFSSEFGFGAHLGFSASVFPIAGGFRGSSDFDNPDDLFAGANHPDSGDVFTSVDSGIYFSFKGDLGRNLSYGLTVGGTFLRTPRAILGRTNTFYPGWTYDPNDYARRNRIIFTRSEPLTYFPFTHRRNWDGSVWFLGAMDAGSFEPWPYTMAFSYFMMPEMAGSLLNGHVTYRIARLDREWASMSNNSSLVLNQSAEPFLAAEITFEPFPWVSFSGLTGVLEYDPIDRERLGAGSGIKDAAMTFQNAFSINILEFNIRNFFRINFGSATVWPKRFHLGYMFPLADTFLTQNNTGDFDNSALFMNIMWQHPGLVKLWLSGFVDEISFGDINRDFFNMTRMMIAYQVGATVHIPWFDRLGFSSLTISYSRIAPYTYSHTREIIPGYGDLRMETNWINFGRPLGHYIPPNSDELLVRFTTMPNPSSTVSFQYQMIRHGAAFGDRAVAGSSYWSELAPMGRQRLRSFFLRDGAYQWMHIFRLQGSYSFVSANLPISVFAEMGAVYSFFTDIRGDTNSNDGPSSFRRINTPEYPRTLSFIAGFGVRIFPKW